MKYLLNLALLIAVACVLTASSSPAYAQNQPTRQQIQQAQQHFEKGAEWFAQGDYAKAIVEFLKGHSIAPNAMFLYNVSISYERLGNYKDAYSSALKATRVPGMPDDVKVRNQARIDALARRLEVEEVARRMQKAQALADARDEDKKDEPRDPVVVRRRVGALTWGGAAVAVVGGGLTVGGMLTNAAVGEDIEELRRLASSNDEAEFQRRKGEIEGAQKLGKTLYVAGGSALALGATLVIVDLLTVTETEVPADTASLYLTPTGQDGWALGLHGMF